MSETEDQSPYGPRSSTVVRQHHPQRPASLRFVAFSRWELNQILRIYGRRVAEGTWRDYAIDHLSDRAVFSIYTRASEVPIYRVEKIPALANRQGAFRVVAVTGAILKRGHDLAQTLRVIDKPKLTLVAG